MVTRSALLTIALLLAAGTARSVHAGTVTRGMRAPPLDARALDGELPARLGAFRGRAVLVEFFGTACPHCRAAVPQMNGIHARFADRGLDVLAVTPDPAEDARRFAKAHGVRHPVARVPMDTLRAYGVSAYPLGILVDPAGRVLWRGRPERLGDRVLTAYLDRVRIAPRAPIAFAAVDADRHAGRLHAVEQALDPLRACPRLDRPSCRYVLDTLAWTAWTREQLEDAAGTDVERARWADAVATWDALELAFPGTPAAGRAAAARARLLADPARAREVEAARALEAARRAGRWAPRAEQQARLRAMAAAHRGTAAATEAQRLLALLSP